MATASSLKVSDAPQLGQWNGRTSLIIRPLRYENTIIKIKPMVF
jgi:hypothetical protein